MHTEVLMSHEALREWANTHEPDEGLLAGPGYWMQIMFVRDNLSEALASSAEQFMKISKDIAVISTHRSKSVLLPVYMMTLPDGTVLVLRHNFQDWKVSITSPKAIDIPPMDLFSADGSCEGCYCEGFPAEMVYGPYSKNNSRFTIEIGNNYQLYTFCWLLGRKINGPRS